MVVKAPEEARVKRVQMLYSHMVEDWKEGPSTVTATNHRTKRREAARLLNVLGGDAFVVFESTIRKRKLWQGYGKKGTQGRYPPMDTVSIWDLRRLEA